MHGGAGMMSTEQTQPYTISQLLSEDVSIKSLYTKEIMLGEDHRSEH